MMTLKPFLHSFSAALVLLLAACNVESAIDEIKEEPPVREEVAVSRPGVVLVKFDEDLALSLEAAQTSGPVQTKSSAVNAVFDDLGVVSARRLFPHAGEFEPRTRREGLHRWYIVSYDKDRPATKAVSLLEGKAGVEYVETVPRIVPESFNDPYFSNQWHYVNTTTPAVDIHVREVWENYTTGRPEVIVNVVDGGVDLTHKDLADNCLASGHFNFVDNNTVIVPNDHGTHVAGTIAAVNNNGIGVAGLAGGDAAKGIPGVKILSSQVFKTVVKDGTSSSESASDFSAAIKWGADHGAVISQNSWGYPADQDGDGKVSDEELQAFLTRTVGGATKDAIDYFIKYAGCDNDGNQLPNSPMKGGVVIFSAGNDALTNGCPANYEKVIAVGSIGVTGTRAYYSCYGEYVDIAAPGGDYKTGSQVYSTLPGDKYGYMQGTSMACPHVSGVAALVVSLHGGPGFTADMLKTRLLESANPSAISPAYQIGPLLDALGAVTYGTDVEMDPVGTVTLTPKSNTLTAKLSVTGDSDGKPAYAYMMMIGTDKAAVAAADPSASASGVTYRVVETTGKAIGETLAYTFEELAFETSYYLRVAAMSYQRNFSAATEIVSATTEANRPPRIECESDLSSIRLRPFDRQQITFSISDPDDHDFEVSYQSGSAADSWSRLSSGYTLIITGAHAEAGSYTATITATDRYGQSTSLPVKYTILENQPPVLERAIGNQFMQALNSSLQLDLSAHFSDPDGESLSYAATVSDATTLHAAVQDQTLYLTGLKFGSCAVTVTASDARQTSASTTFYVLIREAGIEYQAYPNPVEKTLHIATGETAENLSVRIVSAGGITVYEGSQTASAFVPAAVDMSRCAPGRYGLTLNFGGKEYHQTIYKK